MIAFRSALFNVAFFAITFAFALPATAIRMFAPHRVLGFAMLWAQTLVGLARIVCGIRLEVTGHENLPAGAALIASAHQSAFDTFVWLTLVPRCCYVLKHELLRIPLFGGLIRAARMIAIDRMAGASAIRTLLRDGVTAASENRQIVIFPEGTRSEPGPVRDFHPGVAALAARTGLAVVPVATNSGQFWSRKAFTKRPGTIRIVIGQPVPAGLPRQELLRTLRDRIDALQLPLLQPASASSSRSRERMGMCG